MSVDSWDMLPVGIAVATVGMASGVGGAPFYAPLFILALGLPPRTAIASELVVEVVEFGNGVYAYVQRQLIDYRIGRAMLTAPSPRP